MTSFTPDHTDRDDEETDRAYEIEMANDPYEFVSPEDEERDAEMGASFGDARRCPRHPGVKTSSDDGMFDADCYKCEAEQDAACEAYERAQFEFLHPIEAAIQRVESMAYEARRERERAERIAAAADDDICF